MRLWPLSACILLAAGWEDGHIEEQDVPPVQHQQPYTATTTPCCGLPTLETTHYVVVSTMDGKIRALDASNGGAVAWECDFEAQPLMAGNLAKMQPMYADGRAFHVVPALDGSLYMYTQEERLLEPIPLSTDTLLQASVRIGNEAVAGGRSVSTTGIDPVTGKMRYHCSTSTCEQSPDEDASTTLVFRRFSSTVRAVDAVTGAMRWNLSVSEYDASLAPQLHDGAQSVPAVRVVLRPPEGVITAIDGCGQELWSAKLDSHIAKVWQMEGGRLNEISLFDSRNIDTFADSAFADQPQSAGELLFYLGTSNDEPFIMHSASMKAEMKRASKQLDWENAMAQLEGGRRSHQLVKKEQLGYHIHDGGTLDELLTVAHRRAMAVRQGVQRGIAGSDAVAIRDTESCRNGGPSTAVALIGSTDMIPAGGGEHGDQGWLVARVHRPMTRTQQCMHQVKRSIRGMLRVEESSSTWWALLALLTSTISGMISILFYRFFFASRQHAAPIRLSSSVSTEITEVPSEEPITPVIAAATEASPARASKESSTSAPADPSRLSQRTRSSTSHHSISDPFQSKFLADFEPVKLLGKGGFGVVFEARNRLDDYAYAVKRIAVSNNEHSIEKVLREVRTMAKLEHPGITRYYHTWIERPPEGWQEETDREVLNQMKARKASTPKEKSRSRREKKKEEEEDEDKENSEINENSVSIIDVRDLPEDTEGSWMDDSKGDGDAQSTSSGVTSSSDSESDSDGDDEFSEGAPVRKCVSAAASDDVSHSIVFADGSRSSKESLSRMATNVCLVSNDHDLLPSTTAKHYCYLYIQMQLCQARTLHSWLLSRQHWSDREPSKMRGWFAQLVDATAYIHRKGLIHRDIKPQNIFFGTDCTLKIGDLGLATKNAASLDCEVGGGGDGSGPHTGNVGTRSYMSPEQIHNRPYTSKVDVFSLGLILCEMIIPFGTVMERIRTLGDIQMGTQPEMLLKKRPREAEVVEWLTRMDPSERPSCEELLYSDYLDPERPALRLPPRKFTV